MPRPFHFRCLRFILQMFWCYGSVFSCRIPGKTYQRFRFYFWDLKVTCSALFIPKWDSLVPPFWGTLEQF